MNQYKSILESLKGINLNSAAELYTILIDSGTFNAQSTLGTGSMFIFPDGRILGDNDAQDEAEYGTYDRVSHIMIFKYLPKSITGYNTSYWGDIELYEKFSNQASFDKLGKYYNLLLVATGPAASSILIPAGVEPTPEQQVHIDKARKMGWLVEDTSQKEFVNF